MPDVPAVAGVAISHPRSHVTHAWLTAVVFAELRDEAVRRRMHPDQLTAKIVEKAVCRGVIDALLD